MRQFVWIFLVAATALSAVSCRNIQKRAAPEIIDPVPHATYDDIFRDKRAVDAKFGVKNAILGFVFNKINSFIDQKTRWVEQLDRTNIEKNRIHGIEAPKDPVTSLSAAISTSIGQKLQAAGPVLSVVASKLTSGSSGGGHTGFNFGSLLGGLSGQSGAGAEIAATGHAAI